MKQTRLEPEQILEEAKRAERRGSLSDHRRTIALLRQKNHTWRQIAEFLAEHGVETDHTKVFRFWQQGEQPKVPAFGSYANGLLALAAAKKRPTKQQWRMFRFHYKSHNRSGSYRQMGEEVGYKADGANLQYGLFGAALGNAVGVEFTKLNRKDPDSPDFMSSSIGSESQFKNEEGEFQLIMHHELAKAIDKLGMKWLDEQCA